MTACTQTMTVINQRPEHWFSLTTQSWSNSGAFNKDMHMYMHIDEKHGIKIFQNYPVFAGVCPGTRGSWRIPGAELSSRPEPEMIPQSASVILPYMYMKHAFKD